MIISSQKTHNNRKIIYTWLLLQALPCYLLIFNFIYILVLIVIKMIYSQFKTKWVNSGCKLSLEYFCLLFLRFSNDMYQFFTLWNTNCLFYWIILSIHFNRISISLKSISYFFENFHNNSNQIDVLNMRKSCWKFDKRNCCMVLLWRWCLLASTNLQPACISRNIKISVVLREVFVVFNIG